MRLPWILPQQSCALIRSVISWQRVECYRFCFRARTYDSSAYAYHYLSGLLRMKEKRNFAVIGRTTDQLGENIQYFLSNSPWSARAVYQQVQKDIATKPALQVGGTHFTDIRTILADIEPTLNRQHTVPPPSRNGLER